MGSTIALTLGEPAGIGPDIALLAWRRRAEWRLPAFYVIGDRALLEARGKMLGLDIPVRDSSPIKAATDFADALPVADCGHAVTAQPGKPDRTSAKAAESAIRMAVADVMGGRARALVTNPIAKSVMYDAGFTFPGHTEFLAALAEQATGRAVRPVMMLWCDRLAVVPVTIHLALREAIAILSTDLIVETCRIVAHDLSARFGIAHPRLAVSGLNPHAGEGGAMGDEDTRIVAPAVERLRQAGFSVCGPLPADTMFHAAARETYDCAICMYHDQALIPVKTLAFDEAVNVTLGLPFVRTSPDHGTAFDIAGTGRAKADSLAAALRLAARLAGDPAAPRA